jgi:hypothetical protein
VSLALHKSGFFVDGFRLGIVDVNYFIRKIHNFSFEKLFFYDDGLYFLSIDRAPLSSFYLFYYSAFSARCSLYIEPEMKPQRLAAMADYSQTAPHRLIVICRSQPSETLGY